MKILKSHRDHYFLRWNEDDLVQWGQLSNTSSFDYVAVDQMQRGDVTQESEKWLKKNAAQNFDLLGALRISIPRDGMISPIILVSTIHSFWVPFVGKIFWESIPYVIQTGNNRYRVAVENGYTHISSICLGTSISPRVWNFMQKELKKPLRETIKVTKEDIYRSQAERI